MSRAEQTTRPRIDASILGFTGEELAAMSAEERGAACTDALNRAADLLEQVRRAFGEDMSRAKLAKVDAACFAAFRAARGGM